MFGDVRQRSVWRAAACGHAKRAGRVGGVHRGKVCHRDQLRVRSDSGTIGGRPGSARFYHLCGSRRLRRRFACLCLSLAGRSPPLLISRGAVISFLREVVGSVTALVDCVCRITSFVVAGRGRHAATEPVVTRRDRSSVRTSAHMAYTRRRVRADGRTSVTVRDRPPASARHGVFSLGGGPSAVVARQWPRMVWTTRPAAACWRSRS